MPRRRRLLLGLLAALVATGLAFWLLWPRTAITRENAANIHKGMTLAEVETILGGPARDESTGPVVSASQPRGNEAPLVLRPLMINLMFGGAETPRPLEWRSNEMVILVQFDPQGRVILFHFIETCSSSCSTGGTAMAGCGSQVVGKGRAWNC